MKTLFSALTLVALASPALACQLSEPVHIGNTDLLKGRIDLHDVVLYQTPKFDDQSAYDPAKDKLLLVLFNIAYGSHPMGHLGGRLEVTPSKFLSIGFPDAFVGSYNVQYQTQQQNKVTSYQTSSSSQYPGGTGTKQLKVTLDNGYLTKIELQAPVFVKNGMQLSFTGQHQTLCVKSAKY